MAKFSQKECKSPTVENAEILAKITWKRFRWLCKNAGEILLKRVLKFWRRKFRNPGKNYAKTITIQVALKWQQNYVKSMGTFVKETSKVPNSWFNLSWRANRSWQEDSFMKKLDFYGQEIRTKVRRVEKEKVMVSRKNLDYSHKSNF